MKSQFKTIAKYQYSAEAEIIKGLLNSEGIDAFLSDHLTIDTDPIISHAIGGVKLRVPAHQEAEALKIMASLHQYSVDDQGQTITCANCHEAKLELFSTITNLKAFVAFLIGFLFGTLPFHTRYKYRCENCKTEFPIK
ncbi:MAG: DUF2007 domain-containing protein [Algicola sp.]|nr:DUF2007 domain-containing protein [Algicola sp.]